MTEFEHPPITRRKPLSYAELVQENAKLQEGLLNSQTRIKELERLIAEQEEGFEVECAYCGRDVPESDAVSPQGQGIWFCRVCDDELTRFAVNAELEGRTE